MVAHPPETVYQRYPRPSERRNVQAVVCIVLQIMQVHERGLGGVVERETEVPDLGCQHCLGARRKGGVPHGDSFVILEVARLLLAAEIYMWFVLPGGSRYVDYPSRPAPAVYLRSPRRPDRRPWRRVVEDG